MSLPIFWTTEAKSSLAEIVAYLEKEWNEEVTTGFLIRVDEVAENISKNHSLYLNVNKEKNIYRSVVTPQVSLYYKVKENQIDLITFWDNRQNPERLFII